MKKYSVINQVKENGVIAVVRGKSEEDGISIANAAIAGGIKTIELAFTTPYAHLAILNLSKRYFNDKEVLIGAGTVINESQAMIAIMNEARFIVGPSFDKKIAEVCNLFQVPYMPGCVSVTEIVTALKAGSEIIKIFPGGLLKPQFIKDIKGPLPQANLMPSGGVDLNNISDWINNGAFAVSVGSALSKDVTKNNYKSVSVKAKEFMTKFLKAKTQITKK